MPQIAQIIVAFVFGVTFIVALLVLAIKFPHPTPFQYKVFRIVLALAAAGVAAMIPGFININLNPTPELLIRAGGALAIFVIVFFFNPAQMAHNGPVQNQLKRNYFFIVLEREHIISGSASILINSKPVGELQVKRGYEKDLLKVDLSYEGPLKYEIQGISERLLCDSQLNEIVVSDTYVGQGTISPKPSETIYLKFGWHGKHGVTTPIATLEHAPTPPTTEDIKRRLDSIITDLILNPGGEVRVEFDIYISKNREAMNLSKDRAFYLGCMDSDDEIIRYLIDKDWVSESVAAEYQAHAPLGR